MDRSTPDVSIIIPIYNSEQFLRRCIDSVLVQNYSNYEVIMINDGSTDQSQAIIDEYCRNDGRFISIRHENKGVAEARNSGIYASTGKYIIFLDSDDTIHKDTLSDLMPVAMENKPDMVYMACKSVSHNRALHNVNIEKDKIIDIEEFMDVYSKDIQPFTFIDIIYKSDIIKSNNVRFKRKFTEDILFNMQALLLCKRFYITEKIYYFYHSANENSLTSRFFDDHTLISERNKVTLEMLSISKNAPSTVLSSLQKQNLQRSVLKHATARYSMIYEDIVKLFLSDNESIQEGKLAFWGAGRNGARYISYLTGPHLKNLTFVDNNIDKQGGFYYGYPVVSPDTAARYIGYKHVITSQSVFEVYTQMKNLGILDCFADLRPDVGENARYDMQLYAMSNLFDEIERRDLL